MQNHENINEIYSALVRDGAGVWDVSQQATCAYGVFSANDNRHPHAFCMTFTLSIFAILL
jgi:hypothetical protein